ncbi:SPRY domain-containing protein [Burkholderia cenocepacia]|uniref:SPRY domain-containing protein n=1 Tax=Burkholderia cenocepacia TaxID=95486 RepID=UPI002AB76351|nr:SPRY domain-containing protein [Burkholderia cenocepacia]
MPDLKMNQFPDGQLSSTQYIVGYDPGAASLGERRYSATNLISYLTGALPFMTSTNPTMNGNVSMSGGDITFAEGGQYTRMGDVYQVARGHWLSQDMAKLDDAWNKATAGQASADAAARSAAAAAASASSASNNAATSTTNAATAATAATGASNSATLAQAWAAQPAGPVNGTPNYSALYYASQSQYWAGISQAVNASPTTFGPGYKHASIALSNGNLTATFGGTQGVVLGTTGYGNGRHYFEVKFSSGSSSGNAAIGIAPSNEPLGAQIGYNDSTGAIAVFQTSGNVYINGSKVGSVSGFSNANDVLCVAVDSVSKLIWFRSNGGNWNGSATADPVAGTGGFAFTLTGSMFPAVCSDSSAVFVANFAGAFAQTIPAGYRAWAADAYRYTVPTATASTPGIVSAGPGVTVSTSGVLSVDTYYDISTQQSNGDITLDLTNPLPGYRVVLNAQSAAFNLGNFTLPNGKALRLNIYLEQGTGNNTISAWDSRIQWVGSKPVLAYKAGSRNIIALETIDGKTFAGFYIGQVNSN